MNYFDLLPLLLLGLCDFTEEDSYPLAERPSYLKAKLDELTRLLCESGKVFKGKKKPSKELLSWWEEHEKLDRKKNK